MIEKLIGLEKVNIMQCQKLAQDIGFDSMTFDLVGPKGRKKCKWVDAYFGFFQIEGQEDDKVIMIDDSMRYSPNLWCENLMVPEKNA